MRLIVHGATGRMGEIMTRKALAGEGGAELAARVSPDFEPPLEAGCFHSLAECSVDADCVVDFSNHAATEALTAWCAERRLPLLIATTGQTDAELEMIKAASCTVPVLFAANMSLGVALLSELARRAASVFPGADIEIVERHHNQKLDVPSGTALMLARSIKEARPGAEFVVGRHENGKRRQSEIGIHSLRLGAEAGGHEVIISTGTETITISHRAEDRAIFADGAIRAAAWLVGREAGLYTMKDVLEGGE